LPTWRREYKEVPDTEIDNFFTIARAVINPYSTTVLKATITEIYIDPATGLGRAQWSKGDVIRLPVRLSLYGQSDCQRRHEQHTRQSVSDFAETSYVYVPAVAMSWHGRACL